MAKNSAQNNRRARTAMQKVSPEPPFQSSIITVSKGGQAEMNSSLVEDSSEEHGTLASQEHMDPSGSMGNPYKVSNRNSAIYENNLLACSHLME